MTVESFVVAGLVMLIAAPTTTHAQLAKDPFGIQSSHDLVSVSLLGTRVHEQTGGNLGGKGLFIGAAAGAVLGGIIGAATHEPRFAYDTLGEAIGCGLFGGCPPPPQQNSRAGDVFGAAAGMALLGGGLGWLIGRRMPQRAQINTTQVAGRPGLSVRLIH